AEQGLGVQRLQCARRPGDAIGAGLPSQLADRWPARRSRAEAQEAVVAREAAPRQEPDLRIETVADPQARRLDTVAIARVAELAEIARTVAARPLRAADGVVAVDLDVLQEAEVGVGTGDAVAAAASARRRSI